MTKSNGHDKDNGKIVKFPGEAQRKRLRKALTRNTAPANVPFLNLGNIPPFTRFLVGSILLIHIGMTLLLDSGQTLRAYYMFGFVPGYFTGTFDWRWSAPFGILTHMFIHSGWMHILFNSVMGLALGMFCESELGTRRAALFFFACGMIGALVYFVLNPFTTSPIVGASGGISGFFGALLITLHQRNQLGPMGKYGPWPLIIFWAFFMAAAGLLSGGVMAWQTHIGGFLAGTLFLRALQKGMIRF